MAESSDTAVIDETAHGPFGNSNKSTGFAAPSKPVNGDNLGHNDDSEKDAVQSKLESCQSTQDKGDGCESGDGPVMVNGSCDQPADGDASGYTETVDTSESNGVVLSTSVDRKSEDADAIHKEILPVDTMSGESGKQPSPADDINREIENQTTAVNEMNEEANTTGKENSIDNEAENQTTRDESTTSPSDKNGVAGEIAKDNEDSQTGDKHEQNGVCEVNGVCEALSSTERTVTEEDNVEKVVSAEETPKSESEKPFIQSPSTDVKELSDKEPSLDKDSSKIQKPEPSETTPSTKKESTNGETPSSAGEDKPQSSKVSDANVMDTPEKQPQTEEEKLKVKITIRADPKDSPTAVATLTCDTCGFSGNAERAFSEHLMCHLMIRPYQCLQCRQCFVNRRETSLHVHREHDGAKMSCALVTPRALRRAKALIKEALASGAISFYARVGEKVPLEKDPEKPLVGKPPPQPTKQTKKEDTSAKGPAATSESTVENEAAKDDTDKTLSETSRVEENTPDDKTEEGKGCMEDAAANKESNEDPKVKMECDGESTAPTASDNRSSAGGAVVFSRLREVLTSSHADETPKETSNELPGPKIVDSFSLSEGDKDIGTKDCTSNNQKKNSKEDSPKTSATKSDEREGGVATDPNLIKGGVQPDEGEKSPKIISFLGPEQPIFRADDGSNSFLSPPPLIPAPSSRRGDNNLDHFPPPPQLMSASKSHIPSAPSTRQPPTNKAAEAKKNPDFFVCGFDCLFSSMNTEEFREHTCNFHSSEPSFPCFYCGHRSRDEDALVRHVTNHAEAHNKASSLYVCGHDGCRFGTNMVGDYITHIRSNHPQVTEPLCFACGDRFQDLTALQRHAEEHVIHVVNCPHCPCKANERRALLAHIAEQHPGKARMVSVAKQLICHDRKLNDYAATMSNFRDMPPPTLTPAPTLTSGSGSVVDQILRRSNLSSGKKKKGTTLSDILTGRSALDLSDSGAPDLTRVKDEVEDADEVPAEYNNDEDDCFGISRRAVTGTEESPNYVMDEQGMRRRVYVPMSERQAENFRCRQCTFIARDLKRQHCHERSHGMPPTRKDRFKCIFCPQGFDSEMKFRLHITCHPGHIRFMMYRCKKCEFDTNKRETIVKHITCNRDRKHRGPGPVEAQYTTVSRFLESRVLVCERCDYMTRHKIHMAIHYQRAHSILRDKSDFSIPGLTPTDTSVSSFEESKDDEEDELADMDYQLGMSSNQASSTPSPSSQLSPASSGGHKPSQSPSGFGATILSTPSLDTLSSRPASGSKRSRDRNKDPDQPVLTVEQINERNDLFTRLVSQHLALTPDQPVLENQVRKFKCPICQYLLPKAADLKNHVKRHSEVGQITLTMYRCKYCSCMSTARTLLYEHLYEKHPGKPIALVKKIVAIDTAEVDKSFAETAVEESLDTLEAELHQEIMARLNSQDSGDVSKLMGVRDGKEEKKSPSKKYEQLFVIPAGGEQFEVALQCPRCPFSSHDKAEIIGHVSGLHPEVKVIGSDEDVDNLARETNEEMEQQDDGDAMLDFDGGESGKDGIVPSQEDVLIVPDEPVFKEPALCSRCDFTALLRKDMVEHLQSCHPDISVMGRNSYPMQVASLSLRKSGACSQRKLPCGSESCVVGSGSLDAKISRLYENYGTQMRCLICGTERPKKFFIHVHILRHLNIYLWKCAFCAHRGLQKYKMVDHIKKIHPGKAMSVRYLRVNVEAKVAQFLEQFDVLTGERRDGNLDLGDEGSRSSSPSYMSSGGSSSSRPTLSPLYTLGSESLDERIKPLYDNSDGVHFKCLACPNQFQRRFAIHRHIIMSHLKINLLKCAHCPRESVERHLLVDHSLACHPQSPITIIPLGLDLGHIVSEFLTKLANGELTANDTDLDHGDTKDVMNNHDGSSEFAEKYYNNRFFGGKTGGSKARSSGGKSRSSAGKAGGDRAGGGAVKKPVTVVDPDVIMLGRDALDRELKCLYQARQNGALRCLICRWEFPRKYPLHRHMMLKHLRLMLVGCPYCPFEGVEKYNVSSHIKEEHKDMPISIKYVSPDVRSRVKEFVDDMAMTGGSRFGAGLIKKPTPSRDKLGGASKFLVTPKLEKRNDDSQEEEEGVGGADEDENDKGDEEEGGTSQTSGGGGGGLVVAMFGKKKTKSNSTDDEGMVKVKAEVEDDEYNKALTSQADDVDEDKLNEEDALQRDNDDGDDADEGENHVENEDEDDEEKSEGPNLGNLEMGYTPGSFRSPTGGKPKALDVITTIKVLKSREGGLLKFYCELCKFTSLHRSNVVRHIYKIHERYQTHTCPVCSYQTLSLLLMQSHMEKSHPGVEYTEDSFTLNPPRSKPRTPGQSPSSKPLLGPLSFQQRRQDMIAGLGEARKTPKPPPSSSNSSNRGPKQFACAYCHYETDTQDDILQHTKDKHSSGEDSGSRSSPSKSPSRSKVSSSGSGHWDGSKKAIKRSLSPGSSRPGGGGVFREPTAPARKKRFVFEKGDELIHCLSCGVRETSMGRMEEHCAYEHSGQSMNVKRIPAWRFVCRSCSVKTMATSKMKYHLNRHVNYRPYTCSTCGAFFPSPDQCKRHARAQGHDDQCVYARMNKKETRVGELLSEARELAITVQDAAVQDPDFDISRTDDFISQFQETRTTLKRSAPLGSAKRYREMEAERNGDEEFVKPPPLKKASKTKVSSGMSGLLETQPAENVSIKCHTCGEFQAPTVHQVREHHRASHSGKKFLWQDVERGFVCDATGEALPEFDPVPSASGDVGYTTKMTLGAGASPMRFKCKTCDFSSLVIQAMKSHLKSHQPKGFMCAYCSRAFAGKEKLSRHQQCLHPNLPLWTIKLRRLQSNAAPPPPPPKPSTSSHATRTRRNSATFSRKQTARRSGPKASPGYYHNDVDNDDLNFVCILCDFTSDNVLSFRHHLAVEHADTYPIIFREAVPLVEEGVEEGEGAEPKQEAEKEALVVDITPKVNVIRLSEAELQGYGLNNAYCAEFEEDEVMHEGNQHGVGGVVAEEEEEEKEVDEDNEEEIEDSGATVDENDEDYVQDEEEEEDEDEHDEDEEVEERVADDDFINDDEEEETIEEEAEEEEEEEAVETGDEDEDGMDDNAKNEEADGVEEEEDDTKVVDEDSKDGSSKDIEGQADVEEEESPEALARKFGLVGDDDNTDTVILQIDGLRSTVGGPSEPRLSDTLGTAGGLKDRKDATLLSAQIDDGDREDGSNDDDDDDDNDDDDESDPVTFDTDITLASPLPMMSLEDGVSLSPVNMDLPNQGSGADSEMLLDV